MLESAGLTARTERSSRAAPLSAQEAQEWIDAAERVIVCRGRKSIELSAGEATPEDLQGPTGKIRAPLVAVDDTLLVGFHRETLTALLGLG